MSKAPKPDTRAQLLRVNFTPAGPQSSALSDPLEPTPMVLTLDQLRPYELNPRQKQNPKYEEIKESIRARGLDDTPTVSRRPGETDYIIDNGGNTRLKILNDLWKETRDERFYRIHCLFRPWVGDIKALTGHMSENDRHQLHQLREQMPQSWPSIRAQGCGDRVSGAGRRSKRSPSPDAVGSPKGCDAVTPWAGLKDRACCPHRPRGVTPSHPLAGLKNRACAASPRGV